MKSYLSTHLLVALHTIIIAVVILAAAWYIDYVRSETENALMARIQETVLRIESLAEVTDRNGADALTEQIISDCPRRDEFETILNSLNTARGRELITAQQLFESCGAYFAERKALMVAQLEREYQSLEADRMLLMTLRDLTPEELAYVDWSELITLEKDRSALLFEQTAIQGEIISLLIEGGNGARINELVRHAQSVGQSLSVTDAQIDALRNKLMS